MQYKITTYILSRKYSKSRDFFILIIVLIGLRSKETLQALQEKLSYVQWAMQLSAILALYSCDP